MGKELIEVVPEVQFESLTREVVVLLRFDASLVLCEVSLLPQLLEKVDGVHESLIRQHLYHVRGHVRFRPRVLLSIIHSFLFWDIYYYYI